MKELNELEEDKISRDRNRFEQIAIVVLLALLIGLFMGFFSHDHLTQFKSGHPVWKNMVIH